MADTDEAPVPAAFPRVEALFAGEPPPPPAEAGPKIRKLKILLAIGIPLDLLGIPCWTGVIGAAITLWAWLVADAELIRIEHGEYTGDDAARLLRLRSWTNWALGFCVVSLIVQAWLLSTPIYGQLFRMLSDLLGL